MRTASLCAFLFALGCANATEEPLGASGGAPSGGTATSSGGAGVSAGSTASGGTASGGLASGAGNGGNGGSSNGGASNGGSSSSGASSGGISNGGTSKGGSSSGGASKGGSFTGGAGAAGMSSGGALGGASTGGRGGQSSGGTAGSAGAAGAGTGGSAATGGSGGASGCVQNLACKLAAPASTGDLHQDCVDRINQFLTQCACLPALTRRTDGEACADQMAEYDASKGTAHAGYTDKICQPAGSQNECPGYSSNTQVIGLCMQQMWDEGPPPTTSCTGTCYEQHGHYINMTDKSVTKVACGFYTTSAGKVWAVQNFSR